MARTMCGKSVGLVLSGGGSRAYAHVGAIRAFKEAGVEFDFYGGASMGGIIAAGAAMGWDMDELEDRMRRAFVDSNPLSDWVMPVVSLTKGKRVDRRLKEHFGEIDISELPRPFFCVSSSLSSGATRIHRTGVLSRALRASIAIPGLLPPIVDGDDVLVDGAVFNNFPIQELKAYHRGVNVGCDVTRNNAINPDDFRDVPSFTGWVARHGLSDPPPIASLLMRAATAGTLEQHALTRRAADILVLPELELDMREWKRFDEAVEAGYKSAKRMMQEMPNALARRFG
jgi:NTE family protein